MLRLAAYYRLTANDPWQAGYWDMPGSEEQFLRDTFPGAMPAHQLLEAMRQMGVDVCRFTGLHLSGDLRPEWDRFTKQPTGGRPGWFDYTELVVQRGVGSRWQVEAHSVPGANTSMRFA